MIDNLMLGFHTAFTLENLLWCFVGVLLGTLIGVLPGLGSSTGMAVLLPVTVAFDPTTAIIMLAGIYYGSQYGGTITSVLLSTPGEAATVVTTFDGYQMARRGRAGAALSISAIGSFVAAIISLLLLITLAPQIARAALSFGPPEMAGVMLLALAAIVVFGGGRPAIAVVMAAFGLAIALIGVDTGSGTARLTFGEVSLLSGVPFVEMIIGLFALGEVFHQLGHGVAEPIRARFRDLLITREEMRRSRLPILRGTGVGFVFGTLPGAGSTLASFMAYTIERRFSKNRAEFGHGAVEGVAAPESANNAAANANFIPMLTLGVPGGAATAVLLGAFTVYGIQAGPLLFEEQPAMVWGLLASFFIGNVILLILNLPLAPVFAQLLRVRYGIVYPVIIATCCIGAYSISNTMYSVWIVVVFGVIGYLLKVLSLPMAPLIMGLVLGPMLEKAFVQTSELGGGSLAPIVDRPVALSMVVAAALVLVAPVALKRVLGRRSAVVAAVTPPAETVGSVKEK